MRFAQQPTSKKCIRPYICSCFLLLSIPAVLYVSRAEDSPLSDQSLRNYATWWQLNVMKPVGRKKVLEIVMDGDEKIATKCGSDVPKKDGRPRKSGAVRHYNNGWFMAMNLADGKILIIEEMFEPEDNKVALRTIQSCSLALQECQCNHLRPHVLLSSWCPKDFGVQAGEVLDRRQIPCQGSCQFVSM